MAARQQPCVPAEQCHASAGPSAKVHPGHAVHPECRSTGRPPNGLCTNADPQGPVPHLPAGLSGVGTGISGSASDLLGGDVTSGDVHSASTAAAAAAALASGAAAGPTGGDGSGGGGLTPSPPAGSDAASYQAHQSALQLAAGLEAAPGGGAVGAGAVAVVVDSEATGYLMIGALSPGLKRHSVTLFEGGRVAGDDVMRELVDELWASYAAGQGFEGDMLRLTHYAAALGSLLEAVRASAGPGAALELLRKESLAGLAPTAAAKVLHHAYSAVVPISPLPPPVLPLSPYAPGPAHFGPTLEAASPWLSLALYQAARSGPQSFVLVCGQRVWRLPHPLDSCTHALVTLWDPEADPQRVRAHGAEGCGPTLVEAPFLLYTLNELLSRTAVLVQPLWCAEPDSCPDVVDVPLPLPSPQQQEPVAGAGVQGAGGGSQGEGGTGGKGEEGAAAAANAAGGELGGG